LALAASEALYRLQHVACPALHLDVGVGIELSISADQDAAQIEAVTVAAVAAFSVYGGQSSTIVGHFKPPLALR
jgi:hypothetical protein